MVFALQMGMVKKNLMNDLSDSNCIITMHTAIVSDAIF